MEERLADIAREKDAASRRAGIRARGAAAGRRAALKTEIDGCRSQWREKADADRIAITGEDIASIVASWTGIPVRRLAMEESERLLRLEDILHERVIGQDEAVGAVARAIRRARFGLKD